MLRELSGHEIDALHYELLVKDIVAAAEKLPPFPDIAWKIISLVKEMAPVKEIEELIIYDQAIGAKILRLANSVYYGRQYYIRSLKEAMLLLGDKRLVQAVMAACSTSYFIRDGSTDEQELWEHSVTTALISELIARRIKFEGVLTLYTTALLHDIGKTILHLYSKIYLQSSLSEIRGESDVIRGERRALGIDHQELGGIIARKWKFAPDIATAIGNHHNPEKAGEYEELTSLVYLANLLAVSFAKKKDKGPPDGIDPESGPILKRFGISGKMIEGFRSEIEISMGGIVRALGTA
jgi:putative nucleotidyltransferase with HDIG domain